MCAQRRRSPAVSARRADSADTHPPPISDNRALLATAVCATGVGSEIGMRLQLNRLAHGVESGAHLLLRLGARLGRGPFVRPCHHHGPRGNTDGGQREEEREHRHPAGASTSSRSHLRLRIRSTLLVVVEEEVRVVMHVAGVLRRPPCGNRNGGSRPGSLGTRPWMRGEELPQCVRRERRPLVPAAVDGLQCNASIFRTAGGRRGHRPSVAVAGPALVDTPPGGV